MQDGICNIKDGVSVPGARLPQAVGSYMHNRKCVFKWYRLLLPGTLKTFFILLHCCELLHPLSLRDISTSALPISEILTSFVFTATNADTWSKTWEGYYSFYMRRRGIYFDWCTSWDACFGWATSYGPKSSHATPSRMVIFRIHEHFLI